MKNEVISAIIEQYSVMDFVTIEEIEIFKDFSEFIKACEEHDCRFKHLTSYDEPYKLRIGILCTGCKKAWFVRLAEAIRYTETFENKENGKTLRELLLYYEGRVILAMMLQNGKTTNFPFLKLNMMDILKK